MGPKFKAMGLSLVAVTALSTSVVLSARAETGGHFTNDSPTGSAIIVGTESGTHTSQLTIPGLTGIVCGTTSYQGQSSGATTEAVTVTPSFSGCKTTGGTAGEITIDTNGCQDRFTIGKKSTADNTVDLVCPAGKEVVITHPNCEIRMPAQNNIVGAAYTTVVENTKHSITLDHTSKGFLMDFEAGACVLLGTKKEGAFSGSVTVQGFENKEGQKGAQVNITATGSEG